MTLIVNLKGTSAGAVKAWQKKKATGTVISRKIVRTISPGPLSRKQAKPPGTPSGSGGKAKKEKVGRPKKAYKAVAGRRIGKPVLVKSGGAYKSTGPVFKKGIARKTR